MGYRTQSIRPLLPAEDCYKSSYFSRFVVEFTPTAEEDDISPTDSNLPNDMWQLHVDRLSNHRGAGACVVIITPDGTLLEQAITLGFSASNNEAEYEALLARLHLPKELSIKSSWPFMQWPIYLVGPMPTAPAKKEMMIVATNYFTKWIEAEALSSIKEADVE
ncbi:unnamed protein product, partial [Prunus brigantina]